MITRTDSDGTINLSEMGLNLEIKSWHLLKQIIDPISQKILDKIIEHEYKKELDKLYSIISVMTSKGLKEYEEKIMNDTELPNPNIHVLACIERDMLQKLHSDCECIELNKNQEEAMKFAYQGWRYNKKYGFNPGETIEIRLNNLNKLLATQK